MFSAYDLKKIIPRAIFALIAVNLSWSLMEIFIKAVEALGQGAQDLVMAPFGVHQGVLLGTQGTFAFTAIAGTALAAAAIGIIPIVGTAVTALFGVLFAFAIIMLRRLILIGLIIIAPLAIALSVFPQTESWAKKWWDWFSKLMLMYPFIMGMFGLSEVAANIISGTKGTTGFEEAIYQLAAVVLLIVPYFMVGKALSLAGGAIGKVAGMVNNKDRGLIDKTKKWEQAKVAERRSDAKAGARYKDNAFTRPINRVLRRSMNPSETLSLSRAGRRAAAIRAQDQAVARLLEQRPAMKDGLSDDEAELLAMGSKAKAKDRINTRVAEAIARGEDGEKVRSRLELAMATAEQKAGSFDGVAAQVALPQAVKAGRIDSHEIDDIAGDIVHGMAATGVHQQDIKDKIIQQTEAGYKESSSLLHAQLAASKDPTGKRKSSSAISEVIGAKDQTERRARMSSLASQDAIALHSTVNSTFDGSGKITLEQVGKMDANTRDTVVASKQQQIEVVLNQLASGALTQDEASRQIAAHRADALTLAQASTDQKNVAGATAAQALIDHIDGAMTAYNSSAAAMTPGRSVDVSSIETQSSTTFQSRMGGAGARSTSVGP